MVLRAKLESLRMMKFNVVVAFYISISKNDEGQRVLISRISHVEDETFLDCGFLSSLHVCVVIVCDEGCRIGSS